MAESLDDDLFSSGAAVAIDPHDLVDLGDQFSPYSDGTIALTGSDLDDNQSDPDPGSPVELGGEDTDENTLTVAHSNVSPHVTMNLTGQSSSPVTVDGSSQSISGSAAAGDQVDTGPKDGDTTILSGNSGALGFNLFEALFTGTPQQTTGPQTADAHAVTLVQSSQSGLSLGATIVLFMVLGGVAYIVVRSVTSNA